MTTDNERHTDPKWAWTAYEPDAQRPWTLALTAHLYRRAGFGANWQQLQQALADGPQATVSRLLTPPTDVEAFDRTYDEYEDGVSSVNDLRAWWLRRMIETPYPLQEKMTLFWHGYFATNGGALKQPRLMGTHLRLLRRHALGSLKSLLPALAQDPALLVWLNADASRKATPNENFVRPLLEIFTLGPGQFSDGDVREAARAFTGWFVLRDRLRYIPREHDEGTKHVLGRTGEFAGEDVVRIVLEQPATPRTLVGKLYRWFISETDEPSEELIAPLAESFAPDYNIAGVVETMLRSNLFFSSHAYRQKVKSPVEFSIGFIHALEGRVSTTQLGRDVAGLGQDLCRPPTVKGWPGGRFWIDSVTLTRRHNLVSLLLQNGDPYGDKLDPWAVAQEHGCATVASAAQFLLDLLLQNDLGPNVRERFLADAGTSGPEATIGSLAKALAGLPEFQLA